MLCFLSRKEAIYENVTMGIISYEEKAEHQTSLLCSLNSLKCINFSTGKAVQPVYKCLHSFKI